MLGASRHEGEWVGIKAIFATAVRPPTLFAVFVSGVGGWMALADRHMTIDDPDFWVTAGLMVTCGVIGWGSITYDNYRKDGEVKENKQRLADLMAAIKNSEIPLHLRDWSTASNAELKSEVSKIAKAMRAFEAEADKTKPRFFTAWSPRQTITPESRAREINEMMIASGMKKLAFAQQYRPTALALLVEMRRRLGIQATTNDRSIALDLGMLAGYDPIGDAASHIEGLAGKLRD